MVWDGFIDTYMRDEYGDEGLMGVAPITSATPPLKQAEILQKRQMAQTPQGMPKPPSLMENIIFSNAEEHYQDELKAWKEQQQLEKMRAFRQGIDWSQNPRAIAQEFIMNAPTDKGFKFGTDLYAKSLEEKTAKNKYSNIQFDKKTGRAYGLNNETSSYELIPGMAGSPEAPEAENANLLNKDLASVANQMSGSYLKQAKVHIENADNFNKIISLSTPDENGLYNPASDHALIMNYAKLISPGIVTDADYEAAKNSGGLPSQVMNFIKKLENGTMNNTDRRNIVNASARMYNTSSKRIGEIRKSYDKRAADVGLKPYHVYNPDKNYDLYSIKKGAFETKEAPQKPQEAKPQPDQAGFIGQTPFMQTVMDLAKNVSPEVRDLAKRMLEGKAPRENIINMLRANQNGR